MSYVTCPIRRYHPAVVAQKAATMQLLSDGRFTLGLGVGENLNEHIIGGHWPLAPLRTTGCTTCAAMPQAPSATTGQVSVTLCDPTLRHLPSNIRRYGRRRQRHAG